MNEKMVRPKFKPIKQEKISTKIIEQIKSMIIGGDLKPGYVFPSERELAKLFNTSRASLREALNALTGMGLLERSPKSRTVVKSLASGKIIEPLHNLIKEDIQTVFELIEVRKSIETWNARYAALRATKEDIVHLEESTELMLNNIERGSRINGKDVDFHLKIAAATRNKMHSHLMFSIYDLLKDFFEKYYESASRAHDIEIYDQHYKIVEAIKNRDPELASRRMYEHISYAESRMREFSP